MREFAESEIIIPDGPFEGRRYSCDRQPLSALFFEATKDPYWSIFNTTGPVQSGKSLLAFVIPTLYHLFEVGETVICGLPLLDMASDKWSEDLFPVIERSRYRDLLPKNGPGSKGGSSNLKSVRFENGVTLRFMSGGGGDKSRAGFSARVLVVTETDGMDESGGNSREADKLTQLIGRTKSYDNRARVYQECTVSVETGRTWRDYQAGSRSRIAIKCPYCGHFVTPGRDHLMGWRDAEDVIEAGEKSAFVCPDCGTLWSEEDRRTANRTPLLVHKGQTVTEAGVIEGERPRTNILGFRWTATNNLLMKTATIGQDEWKASRQGNEENAEKEMRQFVWAEPYVPSTIDLTVIDHNAVMARVDKELPRGHLPADTQFFTLGIDVGKWLCHWAVVAFRAGATPHIADYGRIEVPSRDMAEELAILLALRSFRDEVLKMGWESPAGRRHVQLGFIDARYTTKSVFQLCDETRGVLFPAMGFGSTQKDMKKFVRRGRDQCVGIGEEYQIVRRSDGTPGVVVEINSDHWKGWVHSRIQTPMGQPGAFTIFRASEANEHLSLAKHITAEKKIEEFEAGKGTVVKFRMLRRDNHWLDAVSNACVAGHAAGARLIGTESIPLPTAQAPAQPTRQHDDERSNWMGDKPSSWVPER